MWMSIQYISCCFKLTSFYISREKQVRIYLQKILSYARLLKSIYFQTIFHLLICKNNYTKINYLHKTCYLKHAVYIGKISNGVMKP